MAGVFHVGIVDGLRPEVARWLQGTPRATRQGLRLIVNRIRQVARLNAGGRMLRRYASPIRKAGHGARGIRAKVTMQGSTIVGKVWPSVGYLAPHELGSTIGPATIRPRRARVLKFEGPSGTVYARMAQRRGFTLPRRPWLSAAYQEVAPEIPGILEREFQTRLFTPGGGGG